MMRHNFSRTLGLAYRPLSSRALDTSSDCSLTFLGTASGGPTISRNATSMILQWGGTVSLFDCGEGTCRQLMYLPTHSLQISTIYITHLHGDHVFGLPSMLLHLNSACYDKKQTLAPGDSPPPPIHVYGPKGVYNLVAASLMLSRAKLWFDLVVHELVIPESTQKATASRVERFQAAAHPVEAFNCGPKVTRRDLLPDTGPHKGPPSWTLPEMNKSQRGRIKVKAVPIEHTIPTVGYVLEETPLEGAIDPVKATALGLPPGPAYAKLKEGQDVVIGGGKLIRAKDVVAPPVKGRKLVILGDTSNPSAMKPHGLEADLLVHEATLESGQEQRAYSYGHSTASMAGAFARAINAARLVLTHFSQRTDRGFFRSDPISVDFSKPGKPRLYNLQGVELPPRGRIDTTAELVSGASKAFRSRSVVAAEDFLTIAVPRGGFARSQETRDPGKQSKQANSKSNST
mmetsp:Transcript_20310/g.45910  ORF Transcript_20310/g.45910 Transcript_20310/m.45910 type:complete len:458 (-) Transcript_20310:270-1643(-)